MYKRLTVLFSVALHICDSYKDVILVPKHTVWQQYAFGVWYLSFPSQLPLKKVIFTKRSSTLCWPKFYSPLYKMQELRINLLIGVYLMVIY